MDVIYDPVTKALSTNSPEFKDDITQLNRVAKDLINLNSDVPESPEPSAALVPMIKKLVGSGVDAMRRQKYNDAIKNLSLALEMSSRRAKWEAFSLQLNEMQGILQIRSDAYLMNKQFLDAYNDADFLIGTQVTTPDNFLRRSISLFHLGRLNESKADLERGLCFKEDERLLKQLKIVNEAIDLENGD